MTRLTWDEIGDRRFETGIDRGVLYTENEAGLMLGVPWNGLVSVEESSSATSSEFYLDGVKYLDAFVPGDYRAKLSAFTYPEEFEPCLGIKVLGDAILFPHQTPKRFGLSYRTQIGDDTGDRGYKLHLVYNAMAMSEAVTYGTLGDNSEASDFSWSISAVPVQLPGSGVRPTAHVVIDSTRYDEATMGMSLYALEEMLYGSDAPASAPAELIPLSELIEVLVVGP